MGSFDEHELCYHVDSYEENVNNQENERIDSQPMSEIVHYISDRERGGGDDYDDGNYDQEANQQDIDDEVWNISQIVQKEDEAHPPSPTTVQSLRPAFSDSGASSAFFSTKGARGPPYQGAPSGQVPTAVVARRGEKLVTQPMPPRSPSTKVDSRLLHNRTKTPVSRTRTQGQLNAGVTLARPLPSPEQPPPPPYNRRTCTPVASNLVGPSASQNGTASSGDVVDSRSFVEPPSKLDTTPLVSNGRKALITPDSSPDRNHDKSVARNIPEHARETGLDWSKTAVHQVTNAVGTLARIGNSFLNGPISPKANAANARQQHKSASTASTPPHSARLQQQEQQHFHPQLHQYTQANSHQHTFSNEQHHVPQEFQHIANTSTYPQSLSTVPHQQVQQQLEGIQNSVQQDCQPDDVHIVLPSALDRMNLEDRSSVMVIQPFSFPGRLDVQSQYMETKTAIQQNDWHPQISSNQDDRASLPTNGPSGAGTEHVSNQTKSDSNTLRLASDLISTTATRPDAAPQSKSLTIAPSQQYKLRGMGHDVTPMMRMRNGEIATNNQKSVHSQKSLTSQMTEEEFRAMKQRKWREKKKLADKTRAQEKERLEGNFKKKNRGHAKRKRLGNESMPHLGACQSGIQNIINNIIDRSCGRMEEYGSESDDDEESTQGSCTDASEDYTVGSSFRSSIQSSRSQTDSLSRVSSNNSNDNGGRISCSASIY